MNKVFLASLLLGAVTLPRAASAGIFGRNNNNKAVEKQTDRRFGDDRSPSERLGLNPPQAHAVAQEVWNDKKAQIRKNTRFFTPIMAGNFQGEHVLLRNNEVTAFLDITDPEHPRYQLPEEYSSEAASSSHILVVPHQPQEHIGKQIDGRITQADLSATLKVFEHAQKIATALERAGIIKKPDVFINPAERIEVGQLHVHIIGDKGAVAYPQALR